MGEVPLYPVIFSHGKAVELKNTKHTTNPHVKTKSMIFRPLIYLDSH